MAAAGRREEGEKDESLDTKQEEAPESLVHVAAAPVVPAGFVYIASGGGPMHVERVLAAVNKKDVAVIRGGPAAAPAVQVGCNLLPVMALVVET